ncbi:hypothetical protein GGI13_006194 [Coemansia sp. RSA 455]|nr:hypothetical protein GGI13_006194 [Coemansia sp. RSA 455]
MHVSLTVNSPRSSSLLIHAALKVFTWANANIFAEPREMPATAADHTLASTSAKRRHGHQQTQSVTQPQLFVEQSTRVARRLSLFPMPLACLIMLMLSKYSTYRPRRRQRRATKLQTAMVAIAKCYLWRLAGACSISLVGSSSA